MTSAFSCWSVTAFGCSCLSCCCGVWASSSSLERPARLVRALTTGFRCEAEEAEEAEEEEEADEDD